MWEIFLHFAKCAKCVGNFPTLAFSWKSKTFLHFMFEIEKSLKSVGSMLPTVYTFGQKIIQLALLISYLRWTVFYSETCL